MNNLILFDDPQIWDNMLPFTFTRPISSFRLGVLTISEKWEKYLGMTPSFLTRDYLQEKYPLQKSTENLMINSAVCPDQELAMAIQNLQPGESLMQDDMLIATMIKDAELDLNFLKKESLFLKKRKKYDNNFVKIAKLWDIFTQNRNEILKDIQLLKKDLHPYQYDHDSYTKTYQPEHIWMEEGVQIHSAIINAQEGPVYLGKDVQIHEGAILKGPLAICEGSHVNMGTRLRGDTTIGPYCKVGGEISNSVIFGYTNKAHDGFLGNSVLGEWCNLGAGTNNSNLKNNYSNVKIWSYSHKSPENTGQQFCGLFMGDHSKCGINTMFNTGTVVGVSSHIFGGGFPSKFIPSFSWGGENQFTTYELDKALKTAQKVMYRRNINFDQKSQDILRKVFEIDHATSKSS